VQAFSSIAGDSKININSKSNGKGGGQSLPLQQAQDRL